MLAVYFKAFIALFVIMDPIGNVPAFLSVTKPLTREEQLKAFSLSVLIAFSILLVFGFGGQLILEKIFHLEIADMQIAGGVLLSLHAIKELTVSSSHSNSSEFRPSIDPSEIACVPLACPLLAGPGALITMLTLCQEPGTGPLLAAAAAISVLALFWIIMRSVDTISRIAGKLVITVTSKVMLILVAAIGVKMIIHGIQFYFPAQ